MAILNKANVALAPWKQHKFDLSCDHVTTHDWMLPQPVYYRHLIPQQKIAVNVNAFTRLQPMSVPTYGRARMNIRAFWIPFEFVQPNFNEFVTNSLYVPHNSGTTAIPVKTHTVTMGTLTTFFIGNTFQNTIVTPAGGIPDIQIGSTNYTFTDAGRAVLKVLRSLGYRWVWNDKETTELSMLPLLSWVRVYLDWYALSAYYDTSNYSTLHSYLKLETPTSFTAGQLGQIFRMISRVCYDGDYFSSAWDNPSGPNTNTFTQLSVADPTLVGNYQVNVASNGTTQIAAANVLSEYQIQALHGLTDYMKRHQLAGAHQVDRFLLDYGVNLSSDKVQRSTYLGCKTFDIKIGDVTQTVDNSAAGQPSNLGDYAGRGIMQGSGEFTFTADSFGILILISSILPSGGYYQGYDRNLRHINLTDFYAAPFDNLGVQAIEKGEVYVSDNNGFFPNIGDCTGAFGYVPRYAEMKVPQNFVTGDFDVKSAMVGGDSWHLMRKFDDSSFNGSAAGLTHSLDFARGVDFHTYDRIFNWYVKESYLDAFYSIYHFDVVSYAPMKSLFDTYDFDHDEEHKHVTIEANGVKVN